MRARTRELLEEYARYHRDPVNRAIHAVAVPLIVFHVLAMLDWVRLAEAGGVGLTLAHVLLALAAAWYVWAAPRLALLVIGPAVLLLLVGRETPTWLVVAIAIAAWAAQLVGHRVFERRAPAFLNQAEHLLVGPLFVASLLAPWSRAREAEE